MNRIPSTVMLGAALARRPRRVALCGNPNVGKSSVFNALTGLRQKVANYPGITVERHSGTLVSPAGPIELIDLPGAYSMLPRSPDERVARDEILGHLGEPKPDVVVVVADAANLERSLFLISQLLDTRRPLVVALNQVDAALKDGFEVDPAALEASLGVPVVPTCGRSGAGCGDLGARIVEGGRRGPSVELAIEQAVLDAADEMAPRFAGELGDECRSLLVQALCSAGAARDLREALVATDLVAELDATRARLEAAGTDVVTGLAVARYGWASDVASRCMQRTGGGSVWQQRADHVLTHPFSGSLVLAGAFFLIFQLLFSWAGPAIDLVDTTLSLAGGWIGGLLGEGLLADFVENGVVAGLAAFLVFVPQILVLFLCIETLEDTGYLARAAFLLDRIMGRAGLPGRAFLPLLSGFACAIPGIMAARTIENRRDRFVTMAVLPLMSCQARLPVYIVITGALFAPFGGDVQSLVIMSMYVLGVAVAVAGAKLLRKTVLAGPRSPLLLELPRFRRPSVRSVARNSLHRTWTFVAGAGPIILVLAMGLWALVTFPRDIEMSRPYGQEIAQLDARLERLPADSAAADVVRTERGRLAQAFESERLAGTYMGRAGRFVAPVFEPLGFDWKMDVAILASFAAREVFVPTLGVIYSVGEADEEDEGLLANIRNDRYPDGRPVFTPLVGLSLLVFYVIAMQCMSTLAVIKRETNSWRWPVGVFVALTVVAYTASLVVFQVGTALGFGQ